MEALPKICRAYTGKGTHTQSIPVSKPSPEICRDYTSKGTLTQYMSILYR